MISLEAFDGLPSWQGALMALGFILVFYVTCGSFQTSSSRREAVASRHVLRSNVVMMFAVLTAIVVVGGMAAAAGTTAAVCAFCGLVAYFATALVAGGAFAGIVVWGVATMATLHIADAGLGLSELTGIYTLFVVAIVMAYPGECCTCATRAAVASLLACRALWRMRALTCVGRARVCRVCLPPQPSPSCSRTCSSTRVPVPPWPTRWRAWMAA